MAHAHKLSSVERRRYRVHNKMRELAIKSGDRMRLVVHKTGLHVYAQVIDDANGKTIAAASTVEKDLRPKGGATVADATTIGKTAAERAVKAGAKKVVFDRGIFPYHGKIKALADGARDGGLEF